MQLRIPVAVLPRVDLRFVHLHGSAHRRGHPTHQLGLSVHVERIALVIDEVLGPIVALLQTEEGSGEIEQRRGDMSVLMGRAVSVHLDRLSASAFRCVM